MFAVLKINWVLKKVSIRRDSLGSDIRKAMHQFSKLQRMRSEDLAAFLVSEEPTLFSDISKAYDCIEEWRTAGKINDEVVTFARIQYARQGYRF